MAISNNSTGLRPGVCTSTTRPTAPYEGQHIYETDTDFEYVWNGSAWVVNYVSAASPAFTGTPTAPTAAAGTNTTQLATTAFANTAGGLVYVGQVTAGSAVTTLQLNNVFSATYNAYKIIVSGGTATGTYSLTLQLINSAATVTTTAYSEVFIYSTYASSGVLTANTSNGSGFLRSAVCAASGAPMNGSFELLSPFVATPTQYYNAANPIGGNGGLSIGLQDSNTSFTGLKCTISGGSMTGTILTVYGYKLG